MEDTKLQGVVDKITALLNKTTARGCTDEEAEAAAEAAQRLMAKYQIDEAMLAFSGKGEADTLDTIRIDIASSYFNPRLFLLDGIAKANDCRVVYFTKARGYKTNGAKVLGFKKDIALVMMMYTTLVAHMESSARRYIPRPGHGTNYKQRESHMMGFQDEVGRRLREARRFAEAQAQQEQPTGSTSMALALVDKRQQVDRYVGKTGKGRTGRGSYDGAAMGAGRQAGRNADIGGTRLSGRKAIGGR